MALRLSSYEGDSVKRVQIRKVALCISNSGNTLWKGMNPTILSPAMGN